MILSTTAIRRIVSILELILLEVSNWHPFHLSVTIYLDEKHLRKVAIYVANGKCLIYQATPCP